ncbi:MAG TPA: high-potential iron-sulfur protein [Chryseosolibacter sp.]
MINVLALLTGGWILDSCGPGKSSEAKSTGSDAVVTACDDLSNVSKGDLETRQKLGYVKESPIPDNQCQNCNLYLPPKNGQTCGGCMLFKGPVFPSSYCTYWAPKV